MRTGLPLIKAFEGCKLTAYKCPAGVWTIGYGRTRNVKAGDKITQAQADAWLAAEYDEFEEAVIRLTNGKGTPNQIGALTSFAYNIGVGALSTSTLLKLHNAGDHAAASRQFGRWNKGGGRILAGLTRRRAAEAAFYLS